MSHIDALWGFLVAGVIAFATAPLAARLARSIGAIDVPRERGLHDKPTPSLGGLAILGGVLVAGVAFLPLFGSAPVDDQTRGIVMGAVAIALVGTADDIWDLPPIVKLAGQAAAGLIPVLAGVRVETFTLPFLGHVDLAGASGPVTLLGIVAVMNIVNFTDGVDGLAAGVCTIAAGTLAIIALSLDKACLGSPATCTGAGVLSAITAGAAFGFLYHNFHPASIFMGDAGSNLLGLLLACVAIQGTIKTAAIVALFFPLAVLAVPIVDGAFVVLKRLKYRRPVYEADRWHLHHRLANIGFSQRRTVLYLYGWTLALAGLGLALRFVPYSDHHGHFHLGWTLVLSGFGLVAAGASLYLVYVLEIFKLTRFRRRQGVSDAEIEREFETGEWDSVG
ncbi:MAG: UDP-GlcNAc:undecaprenyl-phosphate/decaprenyl-phosphate GlcNAc-phosphate transferase [Thermoleophilaceae bacterium]|jgi:UDP-GlcNAc:undecaprenyl-phosphate GlcNAc-1-phosphate transferase|nr:UDP-GlcNAc:undecaprenyl-phosphate/decaprenyl-phosphate GlcNAc-phosphate transferase [Thermoleophilaceae bacterium]